MTAILEGLENAFHALPLSFLEVWGRFGYLVGLLLMVAAFGGFTVRPGGRWGLGRERQSWDGKALLSIPLTMVLILLTAYMGSGIVLVPGAQTFESLKDLAVIVCLLLFGYPALIAVPPAYMLADLIEGVPPAFLRDWLVGYFINPACFWVAYRLIGRNPDFRRVQTWGRYLLFVAIFMSIEPQLWGYLCSGKFTPEISYRGITPALFFTTAVTWVVTPFTMLGALPLARRLGIFWADIPGRVQQLVLAPRGWRWQSAEGSSGQVTPGAPAGPRALPIRVFIAAPFLGLVLLTVGAVAYLSLRWGEDGANALASRLHQEISETLRLQLDDYLAAHPPATQEGDLVRRGLGSLLAGSSLAQRGRAFIVDREGRLVASSASRGDASADRLAPVGGAGADAETADPVIEYAARGLERTRNGLGRLGEPAPFRFDIVTAKPLARATWLALATPYGNAPAGVDWIVVTAMPEADYLDGIRAGHSQSAMVVAAALVLGLLVSALLAAAVTAPILRLSRSAQAMARGDLKQRVASSRLEEPAAVAASFNDMAEQLEQSRELLEADIRHRREIEKALRASEENLEVQVLRRTQELANANKELEAFSYSVSHDLRTPLRALDGFAQILGEDYGDRLDDAGRQYLDGIHQATVNMARLIDCLLDLARVSRRQLVTQPVSLSALADEVVRDLRRIDPSREVDVRIDPDLGAEADPQMIRQALQNLIGNAWKFTARAGRAQIRVGSTTVEGRGAFFVEDNGAGFDMAYADKLFGAFQRLHGPQEFEGSGVGLAIVQRIVTRHGGRVWARGAVNQGATIYFTLPGPAVAPPPDVPGGKPSGVGDAPG